MAAVSSVVIDGATIVDVPRTHDVWQLDPRLPDNTQTGAAVYDHNDLDRGHLTRRRDPGWGPAAGQANTDTFHYTNAAPQAAVFNQSKQLWNGLEDYLLANATTNTRRLVVHTGPVLDPTDPAYRGVLIPRRFFKVGGFLDAGALAATGYVLDQTPQLDTIDLHTVTAQRAAAGDPPPLGPYKTYQVPITDIVAMTGLDFAPLTALDRYSLTTHPTAAPTPWAQLTAYTSGPVVGAATSTAGWR